MRLLGKYLIFNGHFFGWGEAIKQTAGKEGCQKQLFLKICFQVGDLVTESLLSPLSSLWKIYLFRS